jgi:hypothetical protein
MRSANVIGGKLATKAAMSLINVSQSLREYLALSKRSLKPDSEYKIPRLAGWIGRNLNASPDTNSLRDARTFSNTEHRSSKPIAGPL